MFPADAREAAEIIVVGDDSRVVLHTGEPFLSSARDDGGGFHARLRERLTNQCAASCQDLPTPTDTSSGTLRVTAWPILVRTSSSSASCSPDPTSKTSSS